LSASQLNRTFKSLQSFFRPFILLAIATRYRSFDRSACAVTSTTDLRRLRQSLHSSCEQVLAGLSIFSLSSLACTCSLLPRIALAVLLVRST